METCEKRKNQLGKPKFHTQKKVVCHKSSDCGLLVSTTSHMGLVLPTGSEDVTSPEGGLMGRKIRTIYPRDSQGGSVRHRGPLPHAALWPPVSKEMQGTDVMADANIDNDKESRVQRADKVELLLNSCPHSNHSLKVNTKASKLLGSNFQQH